jgi:four helix bundle protein
MKVEKQGLLNKRTYLFAIEIVKLCKFLNSVQKEYILSKQLIRSGTAIGAIIREAEYASSKQDFIYKLTLSLKEANETVYWLMLLVDTQFISDQIFKNLENECNELISMLISSIKTAKSKFFTLIFYLFTLIS